MDLYYLNEKSFKETSLNVHLSTVVWYFEFFFSDIEEIQSALKNKSFDGNHLKVHPVEVSNCIIVRGYSEETTYEAIENYFDNKRRSGVENVTECKMNEEENYCVIYFEDPKGIREKLCFYVCAYSRNGQFIKAI